MPFQSRSDNYNIKGNIPEKKHTPRGTAASGFKEYGLMNAGISKYLCKKIDI